MRIESTWGTIPNTGLVIHTDIGGQEYLEEGSYKIVDTLHVSAGGVPNGPYIQYPL